MKQKCSGVSRILMRKLNAEDNLRNKNAETNYAATKLKREKAKCTRKIMISERKEKYYFTLHS
jgi:hypothetical protein